VLVTPDMSNAAANVNFFGDKSTSARGAAQSSYARTRSTAITHELGHIMGLLHQGAYDANGTMTATYRGADSWNIAPIMGVDYAGKFSSWQNGFTGANMTPQNDIVFMTNKITTVYNNFTGGSYSGDGFRADEHGNTFATATLIGSGGGGGTGGGGDTGGGGKGNGKGGTGGGKGGGKNKAAPATSVEFADINLAVMGVIERYNDIDMFSFNWLGGSLSVIAEAAKNVAAQPMYASSLGMNLRMYDTSGTLLAQNLSANPADVDAALSFSSLIAGQYYFAVSSFGGYDDLGAYSLTLSGQTAAALQFAALSEPTDLTLSGQTDGAYQFAAVPEPTSLALFVLGGLLVVRRRCGR